MGGIDPILTAPALHDKEVTMARSQQYMDGQRTALKWVVTWLHRRADSMNDQRARQIMNAAAFDFANAKKAYLLGEDEIEVGPISDQGS
jgi:hypothetical protein